MTSKLLRFGPIQWWQRQGWYVKLPILLVAAFIFFEPVQYVAYNTITTMHNLVIMGTCAAQGGRPGDLAWEAHPAPFDQRAWDARGSARCLVQERKTPPRIQPTTLRGEHDDARR